MVPRDPYEEPQPSRAASKRRQRQMLMLGAMAIALSVMLWLIHTGFLDLNAAGAAVMRRLSSFHSSKSQAYSYVGKHHSDVGRADAAVKAGENLVQVKPEVPQSHVVLGDAYRDASQRRRNFTGQKAITCYRYALQLDPNCYDAHLGMGEGYSQMGTL